MLKFYSQTAGRREAHHRGQTKGDRTWVRRAELLVFCQYHGSPMKKVTKFAMHQDNEGAYLVDRV
jgi:hypothetical protein